MDMTEYVQKVRKKSMGGRRLVLETARSRARRRASGPLWRHHVLATVVFEKKRSQGLDFSADRQLQEDGLRRGRSEAGFFKARAVLREGRV